MKKLRLDVDLLTVETFDTTAQRAARLGTVRGRQETFGAQTCIGETCGTTCPSGGGSCGGLCTYYNCPPMTYEYETCGEGNATETCGPPTDNTGCGQATCGNGTCAVNTCPAETA
jgi:hypothetical protein